MTKLNLSPSYMNHPILNSLPTAETYLKLRIAIRDIRRDAKHQIELTELGQGSYFADKAVNLTALADHLDQWAEQIEDLLAVLRGYK